LLLSLLIFVDGADHDLRIIERKAWQLRFGPITAPRYCRRVAMEAR
jgi:hypothetical protein